MKYFCISLGILLIVNIFVMHRLLIQNTQVTSTYNRCEQIVNKATAIMTRQQRWQFHKRIEDLNVKDEQ